MSADWDASFLLEPISAEEPCGKNLDEKDPLVLAAFDDYELWGQSTLEPQKDDLTQKEIWKKHRPPEWPEIKTLALDVVRTTKDLRVLAHLGVAVLRTDGIRPFLRTLDIASQWLDEYWNQVFPLLEDGDAIFRRNALNSFADPIAVVDGLKKAPLVENRQHGRFSLRGIEIATGQTPPTATEPKVDEAQVRAAFGATPIDELTGLSQAVIGALAVLKKVDLQLRGEGGVEAAPNFEPLSTVLKKMDVVLRTQLEMHPARTETQLPGDESAAAGEGGNAGSVVAVGSIRSRQDAIRALEAAAEFFRRNEPSSPIPMFLDRAKRLVSKDFFEVLADIAPEALASAKSAGGVKDE